MVIASLLRGKEGRLEGGRKEEGEGDGRKGTRQRHEDTQTEELRKRGI